MSSLSNIFLRASRIGSHIRRPNALSAIAVQVVYRRFAMSQAQRVVTTPFIPHSHVVVRPSESVRKAMPEFVVQQQQQEKAHRQTYTHEVVTTPKITSSHIAALLDPTGPAALVVRGWYDRKRCQLVADRLKSSSERTGYTHEVAGEHRYLGVDRIGTPFNLTYGKAPDSAEVAQYYNQSLRAREVVDEVVADVLSYLSTSISDKFTAEVASYQGRRMHAGVGRVTNSNKHTEEFHVDALPPTVADLRAQIGFNVYVDAPPQGCGGELEVMDVDAYSQKTATSLPPDYDFARAHPNAPSILIAPTPGDLVFINTRRPHATKVFTEGSRIAVASFIGQSASNPSSLFAWA